MLTSVGLSSAPVLNNVGSIPSNAGYLKASPDGTKIIAANTWGSSASFLFDFNRTTGILSNVINFPSAYGAEFSPSNDILYLSTYDYDSLSSTYSVSQYDLLAGSSSDIANSEIILSSSPSTILWFAALQLASDGKIYHSIAYENSLAVINSPDILGVGCNYIQNGISLSGNLCKGGLPTFHSSIFSSPSIVINNVCLGDSTSFTFTGSVDSVLWYLGDSTLSTLFSPTHVFQDTGTYTITLLTYLGAATDTLLYTVTIVGPVLSLNTDTVMCDGEILTLDVTQTDATYLWQDGSTNPTFTVTSDGTYSVDLTLEGCSAQASISVIYNVLPTATISGDFSVCEDQWSYFPIVCTGVPDFSVSWTNGTLNGTATGRYLIKIPAIITGVYTLVNIVDEAGCVGNVSGSANLVAHPKPIADFVLTPAVTFIDNTDITFTNLSSGHISSVWDFDDGSSLLNDNSLSIVHHYDNPGDYIIKLEVTSNFGCVASAINSLEIIPFEYFVPDAFTPNSDALNDVFNINTTKVKSFEMEIFDRWGESVYITKNVWKPWDGTFNGTALEQGVYAYKIWVKDPQDILHKMVGNVLLVR